MRDPEKTIGAMADKQKIAFLGSVDAEGFPNVKAMLRPRKREGIREFWFTTNTSSMRVSQFLENPKACVYFCDQRFFRGAMLRGTVEVLTDDLSEIEQKCGLPLVTNSEPGKAAVKYAKRI